MKRLLRALGAALLGACVFTQAAQASVVIAGTRVVFPAAQGEVTLRLTNDNTKPALVEAWIDRGNVQSTPDKVDTPFLITPPLFRMEPQRDQNLRIIYTKGALPTDRESLFWLNVLEVPPKPSGPQAEGRNYLQLAIRSRLKLFFRPAGLEGDPLKAAAELTFTAAPTADGYALKVHNPTPYHVTISGMQLSVGATRYKTATGMVAPMSELSLAITGLTKAPPAGSAVTLTTINDFGAQTSVQAVLTP